MSPLRSNAAPWCAAVILGAASLLVAAQNPDIRDSRFFKVDVKNRRVLGPTDQVPGALRLTFFSVTTDQPQYWPQEMVRLKVLLPTRPGTEFKATLQKRDAAARELVGKVDDGGVAVLELMDGSKSRLELGEYRVDVRVVDGPSAHTTFSVVEGTLGAVSLAHDFKQVTSIEALEQSNGAWFLGNPSGAGKRWGNGLSFKNELRVANTPYNGEVLLISRCMLPGCNGVQAGREKKISVVNGKMEGSMEVGGHSGPFQIEFVTPKGSLRHQFEGSSHVERDFVMVSGGVTWTHRAGLAPYENTTQVPGRQIFLEKSRASDDPYDVESLVADKGNITLKITKTITSPSLLVWTPKLDGTFASANIQVPGEWKGGTTVNIPVAQPYVFVTVGGFLDQTFREGWVMAFSPSGFKVDLDAPTSAGPGTPLRVTIDARSLDGAGLKVSGILEAYDNRVVVKNALNPLNSNLGDAIRSTSQAISYWEDRTGIDPRVAEARRRKADEAERSEERSMAKESSRSPATMAPPPPPSPSPKASMPMKKSKGGSGSMARPPSAAPGGSSVEDEEEPDNPAEIIREGEKKVVFCGAVTTDAGGRAVVDITLPPQLGRVALRFVAVKGYDFSQAIRTVDVSKRASVEARLPRLLIPGARLATTLDLMNGTSETLTLSASGAGLARTFSAPVAPGRSTTILPLVATAQGGTLVLTLAGKNGKVLDERRLALPSVGSQPVTYSRLEVSSGAPINVQAGESVSVYGGAGDLLKGTVMAMVTTMESWFGHSEALSAQVAARAVILAAISRGIVTDEGLRQNLRSGLIKATRDLQEAFMDPAAGLIRPYPGLPGNPLWSAWVSRNLHSALRTLRADATLATDLQDSINLAETVVTTLDASLRRMNLSLEEQGGFDGQGRDVIPVEIDGKVVYRVLTDDAVTTWATQRLLPLLDAREANVSHAMSKAYDTFRFLRAFERVGALQYLTQVATALYLQGRTREFTPLFARITRGMILAQEPGMVQGPATLGGVYSTPMAMVRYLELLLLMSANGVPKLDASIVSKGSTQVLLPGAAVVVKDGGTVRATANALVRLDSKRTINMLEQRTQKPFADAGFSSVDLAMAAPAELTIQLGAEKDPLEYYALIAAPSTVVIRQTEDILSDYKGQLIYGQQATGGQKMQLIAVPFRGTRTMRLWIEGAYPGSSPGVVVIRHVENADDLTTVQLGEVQVK